MSELRNQQSAYSYPSPAQTITKADITLREILDTYREDNDLLKLILATKTEEDKRRAEEEKCKTEKVRLQCKQVELELLKEQKKPPTIFTGAQSINSASSTANFNVKSPSDINSPYLSIQPPLDSHFSNTTPTSATTHFSPPPSANNHNNNHIHDHMSYGSTTNSQSHSYHHHNNSNSNNNNNNNSATNNPNQKPSLTLSIPSFPTMSSSPTVMHGHHSFSNPNSGVEHPHSASPLTHRHSFYSQSPTSAVGSKRTRPSENEVDHEYVMEAIRAKVQRNQEHPAKKYMNVLKPRSASMPVPPMNNNSPTTSSSNNQHINREHNSHNQNHHLNHHNHNGNNNNNNNSNNISNNNSNHHKQQRQQSSPPPPTPPLPISLPPTPQHHHQRSHHSTQQNPQTSSSPVDPSPLAQSHSPIPPPQLPPINVHSPGLNQDSKS